VQRVLRHRHGRRRERDHPRVSCGPQTCGNGVVEGVEQCDDGNAVDTDACNDSCGFGPITVGGNAHQYIDPALTALGETFTQGGTYPAAGNGVFILSNDGGNGPFVDYTSMLNAGAHILLIGGSNLGTGAGSYTAYVNTYVTTDNTSNWHQSSDCVNDWNAIGTHPITQFLPATYEFTNQSVSYHMLHLSATQPTGATLIGQTCASAAHNPPGVLVTRTYPSGGTLTVFVQDVGNYSDANTPTQFLQPFLKGYLAYVRGPH
jgi:cysteine-rich repeat protein